jgi:hypothetical protein
VRAAIKNLVNFASRIATWGHHWRRASEDVVESEDKPGPHAGKLIFMEPAPEEIEPIQK